eukprot:TRINITY_DN16675_c2_g1_i2.p2 TRINITY_DN16675_c2_g1~~TRINITY_DN16675_c2_g1_i2.p2  ORF type:complete len:116 (-),score=0.48 TRINITY_DN16675_c2_g1_i2:128-475(-)
MLVRQIWVIFLFSKMNNFQICCVFENALFDIGVYLQVNSRGVLRENCNEDEGQMAYHIRNVLIIKEIIGKVLQNIHAIISVFYVVNALLFMKYFQVIQQQDPYLYDAWVLLMSMI